MHACMHAIRHVPKPSSSTYNRAGSTLWHLLRLLSAIGRPGLRVPAGRVPACTGWLLVVVASKRVLVTGVVVGGSAAAACWQVHRSFILQLGHLKGTSLHAKALAGGLTLTGADRL